MVRIRDIHSTIVIDETDSYDKAMKIIIEEGYAIIKENVTHNNDIVIWIS